MEDEGTYGEGRGAASIIYGVEAAALKALVTVVRAVWRGSRARRSDSEAKISCEIRETECTLADTVTPPSLFRRKFHNGPNRMIAGAVPNQQMVQKPRCIRCRVKTNAGRNRKYRLGTGTFELSGHLSVAFSNVHVTHVIRHFKLSERVGGGGPPLLLGSSFRRDGLGVGQAGRGAGQEMAGDRYKEAKEVSVGRERQGPIKRIASTIMEEGDFGDWALKDLEPERD
ncbi:hypothetical protein EDB83DRAFT_2317599 [Lactarius deliciosus]|nr:hypothetical protein EDB83DRAFT_2317599 [Lactarius deliciosus]